MIQLTAMSFGAGVQSTAMMLLLKHQPEVLAKAVGELPSIALFSDTGAESHLVYAHLERMLADGLPIPLETVSNGNLETAEGTRSFIPYYTRGEDGEIGMVRRKCTAEFKVLPLERRLRELAGLERGQKGTPGLISIWMGISTDEVIRMRQHPSPTMRNVYPLVEIGWDRGRCLEYARSFGFEPPKSRCFMCPYTRDWARVKCEEPWTWRRAVAYDRTIRDSTARGIQDPAYLHRLAVPLDEAVELMALREATNGTPLFGVDFAEECSGYCGL